MNRPSPALAALFLCVGILVFVGPVQAAEITFTDSVPLMTTTWRESVTIPQFDPALGTLTSIEYGINGYIEGSVSYESLDSQPSTLTLDFSARLELGLPNTSKLILAAPLVTNIVSVGAFDGVIDFGGTSGGIIDDISVTDRVTFMSTPPSTDELNFFVGTGTVDMSLDAIGTSSGAGSGNLVLQFLQSASASVDVTYTYTAIPEPATLSLLLVPALLFPRRRS